jgi:hypothetical protein
LYIFVQPSKKKNVLFRYSVIAGNRDGIGGGDILLKSTTEKKCKRK